MKNKIIKAFKKFEQTTTTSPAVTWFYVLAAHFKIGIQQVYNYLTLLPQAGAAIIILEFLGITPNRIAFVVLTALVVVGLVGLGYFVRKTGLYEVQRRKETLIDPISWMYVAMMEHYIKEHGIKPPDFVRDDIERRRKERLDQESE